MCGAAPSGAIRVAAVDGFARIPENGSIKLLTGHTDKITCLAAPDLPNKNYLLSGSADFTVRVWNLEYVLNLRALRPTSFTHPWVAGTVHPARWSRCTPFRTTRAR